MGIHQNNQLKLAPSTIKRDIPLPLLETHLPQKERIDSMENKGKSNKLSNPDKDDGQIPTTPATPKEIEENNEKNRKRPATELYDHDDHGIQPSPKQLVLQEYVCNEKTIAMGYDSEGCVGPFWAPLDREGPQVFEEAPCGQAAATTQEEGPVPAPAPAPAAAAAGPHMKYCKEQNIASLRKELKLRGQPAGGKKLELIHRLNEAMERGLVKYSTVEEAKAKSKPKKKKAVSSGMKGMKLFPDTAYWEVLDPMPDVVQEPLNPRFKIARAPTIAERDAKYVPQKFNYPQQFDIPEFKAVKKELQFDRRGKAREVNGQPLVLTTPRLTGSTDTAFKAKHKLHGGSKPWEVADAFIPYRDTRKKNDTFSFELLARYTNQKASFFGAGSTIYEDEWKEFTAREIRQHFGLYICQGLDPSNRVEKKFNPQRKDWLAGNDFVFDSFNGNARRRHKHFKAFLGVCDPLIRTPDRDHYPNWKVRPILKWMNYQCPLAWNLGRSIAVDEMTMRFQGMHRDKRRITYKNEGDGFQADALCDDGYCYQIYMRNDPAPKKYLKQGLSPLHSRTMALFDSLKDDYHHVGMDNLYNSAAFCRAGYNHKRKVLCHGVTRKAGRGIPESVLQQEVLNPTAQREVRGTVKAAVLKGDPDCPNLVASSVYDSKPVHYLSMVSDSIQWVIKEKKVFNVDTDEVEAMQFLRLNQIDKYNNGMGDVDVADQLRGVYRLDRNIRNRKWWWSLLFWSMGVLLTNAYKFYLRMCEEEGVVPLYKEHYEFRKAIAEYWLNPERVEERVAAQAEADAVEAAKQGAKLQQFDSPESMISSLKYSPTCYPVSGGGSKRGSPVTDKTLGETGALSCRLNRSLLHMAQPSPQDRPRCALHWWGDKRTQSQIAHCRACNVNLCLDCFAVFHLEPTLAGLQEKLEEILNK